MYKFFRKEKSEKEYRCKKRHICPIIKRLQAEGECLKSDIHCDKEYLRSLKPFGVPCCINNKCLIIKEATGPRVYDYCNIIPSSKLRENIRMYYVDLLWTYLKNKTRIVFISML